MNSAFPASYLLEGWPGSLTGLSRFHQTCSSLVSKQVGVHILQFEAETSRQWFSPRAVCFILFNIVPHVHFPTHLFPHLTSFLHTKGGRCHQSCLSAPVCLSHWFQNHMQSPSTSFYFCAHHWRWVSSSQAGVCLCLSFLLGFSLSSWRKISQWFPGCAAGADQGGGRDLAV